MSAFLWTFTQLRREEYHYNDASEIDAHTVNGAATTYGYDLAGQVQSESRTGYSGAYTYDANGNRLTRTVGGVTETLAYDVGDKLQTVKIGGVTQRSYAYNAAGSATSVTTSAGTTAVGWDEDERVKSMSGPGLTGTSSFAYNGEGTRLSATENGATRSDLRDGTGVTAPVLNDGQAAYTPGISERRSSVSTFDHAGVKSFAAQTSSSSSGAVAATRQYDAFGNLLSSTGTFKGPFGYGGAFGYREDASGLKVLGHRLYDASAGRFLSRDPIRDGRNWYAYCGSDPVNGADPTGLIDWTPIIDIIDENRPKPFPSLRPYDPPFTKPGQNPIFGGSDGATSGGIYHEPGVGIGGGIAYDDGKGNGGLVQADRDGIRGEGQLGDFTGEFDYPYSGRPSGSATWKNPPWSVTITDGPGGTTITGGYDDGTYNAGVRYGGGRLISFQGGFRF